MPERDRVFRAVVDRNDMRVILAAELGRFGAEKKLIGSMDELVRKGVAEVFVSDDKDELVMLRVNEAIEPCYVVVTEARLARVFTRTIQ
jgi:hypothetical protein